MEKHCEVCKKPYPGHLTSCPHCQAAHPGSTPDQPPPDDVFDMLVAQTTSVSGLLRDTDEARLAVMAIGDEAFVSNPDINLDADAPKPADAGGEVVAAEAGGPAEAVTLFEEAPPPTAPYTPASELTAEMPAAPEMPEPSHHEAATLGPDDAMALIQPAGEADAGKKSKTRSLLAAGAEAAKPAAPAKPSKKTMLADEDQDEDAIVPASRRSRSDAGAPATKLVLPEEMAAEAEAAPEKSKQTKLAAGAAATTKLAPPEEVAAEVQEGEAPADPKRTKLAAAGAPKTKLAPLGELDLLTMPPPQTEEDMARGSARSAVDLGSDPIVDLPSIHSSRGSHLEETAAAEPSPETASADDLDKLMDEAAAEAATVADDEVVATEAVDEEVAEVEEEPVVKQKKPSALKHWVGGGVLGALVGGAATFALIFFEIIPTGAPPAKSAPVTVAPRPTPPPPQAEAPTVATGYQLLDSGNFTKALDILDKAEQADPEVQSRRGQARWLQYLQKQKQANLPLNPNDEAVVQARKDLTEASAKSAEATYWLGLIEEGLNKPAEARKIYEEGLKLHAAQERLFKAALNRLDVTAGPAEGGAQSRLMPDGLPAGSAPWTLLYLTTLQAPAADPAAAAPAEAVAAAGNTDEAGFEFWNAVKLSREQKFSEAVEALQKSIKTHETQRFLRLRKAQNPTSDPTEEIYLRGCNELLAYWKMRQSLALEGFKQPDPQKALEEALKSAKDKGPLVAIVDRLKKEKDVTEADPDVKDPAKGLEVLLDAKKKNDTLLADIRTALEGEKYVTDEQKDLAAGLKKLLQDKKEAGETLAALTDTLKTGKYVSDDQPDVAKGLAKLIEDKKTVDTQFKELSAKFADVDGTLTGVVQKLTEAEYLGKKAGRDDVLTGLDRAIGEAYAPVVKALSSVVRDLSTVGQEAGERLARDIDLTTSLAASQASVGRAQAQLLQSRTARQMLDVWLPLLQERYRKDVAEQAVVDAQRVAKDESAPADARSLARLVEGLALRNLGKFGDARKAIEEALRDAGPATGKSDWRPYGQQALRELTEPEVYYLPLAEELRASGKANEALTLLNGGLEVFGKEGRDAGHLLALRSIVQLDLARGKGKLNPQDPQVQAAAKDAEAAVAAGAEDEGNYAAGLVAEATGDLAKAQQSYRRAIAAHGESDRVGSRYRLALARVLLQLLERRPAAAPAETNDRTGQAPAEAPAEPVAAQPAGSPLAWLAALVVTAQVADDLDEPKPTPELDEAIKLAEQSIRAGNYEGHFLKAKALAKKGRWNEALKEYSLGMQRVGPNSEYARGLRDLTDNHPALKIPDGASPAEPLLAEKHYAAGLRNYYARRYPAAENEFTQAVSANDQDARFLYFLGLAKLSQGKRAEAYEAFRRGGALEQQNKPNSGAISAILERVQGPDRWTLNRFRP